MALLAATIAGCANGEFGNDNVIDEFDTFASVRDADLSARSPRGSAQSREITGRSNNIGGRAIVYAGGATSAGRGRPLFTESTTGNSFNLNFEQTDIATAARVIFTDILKEGYIVDPRVSGTVSLSTGRAVSAERLLLYFESALAFSGAAIVPGELGYRIVPIAEARELPTIDLGGGDTVRPGYGVSILPLEHVSAETILPLLDSFVVPQSSARVDVERNTLLFVGPAASRRAAMEAALSFDEEWLSDQAVGLYSIQTTNPEIVIREVEEILQTQEGGRGAGLVRMLPMERLNGVLIVAQNQRMLQRTLQWMERLDQNSFQSAGIRVYQVQYADATRLAATLNAMFLGGSSSASAPASASDQFPPDAASGFSQENAGTAEPALAEAAERGSAQTASFSAASGQEAILQDVRISADATNNTILVYADNENYEIVERAIAALDQRPQQVVIETTIAEVTLNNELRHGVQFFFRSSDFGLGDDNGSIGLVGEGVNATISRALPGFNLLFGPEDDPRYILDALRSITDVKVLSQPTVVVQDNNVATLQIGDEVPITTQTAQSVENPDAPIVNSVEFRDTGVILSVRPRISANGVIGLDIKQEISSVVANVDSLTPTISQRSVSSALSTVSGQTVLLGGLISQNESNSSAGLPGLSDKRRWGDLFGKKRREITRTELILLIRPRVLRDEHDASAIANEMRHRLQLMNQRREATPIRVLSDSIIQ
ncbi:MAG: type II secretion system secretin GspD [Pseudomonadota bacterium]